MKINKDTLRHIIRESIDELLSEAQTQTVDNFQRWAKRIDDYNTKNGADNDKVWFIQIMTRMKDNKNDTKKAAQLKSKKGDEYAHGALYGNFKNGGAFLVRNGQELMAIHNQVKTFCDKNNARCVIWANPRSESDVKAYVPKYQSFFKPGDGRATHALEVLFGQCKYDAQKFPDRKVAKIDVDTTEPLIQKLVNIIIKYYDPNSEAEKSPSGGLHVYLTDQYAPYIKEMCRMLRIIDAYGSKDNRIYFPDLGPQQMAHFNPDANFVLYANVDTPGY